MDIIESKIVKNSDYYAIRCINKIQELLREDSDMQKYKQIKKELQDELNSLYDTQEQTIRWSDSFFR